MPKPSQPSGDEQLPASRQAGRAASHARQRFALPCCCARINGAEAPFSFFRQYCAYRASMTRDRRELGEGRRARQARLPMRRYGKDCRLNRKTPLTPAIPAAKAFLPVPGIYRAFSSRCSALTIALSMLARYFAGTARQCRGRLHRSSIDLSPFASISRDASKLTPTGTMCCRL